MHSTYSPWVDLKILSQTVPSLYSLHPITIPLTDRFSHRLNKKYISLIFDFSSLEQNSSYSSPSSPS